jgi:hypothetical protein
MLDPLAGPAFTPKTPPIRLSSDEITRLNALDAGGADGAIRRAAGLIFLPTAVSGRACTRRFLSWWSLRVAMRPRWMPTRI